MMYSLLVGLTLSQHAYQPARKPVTIDSAPTLILHDAERDKDLEVRVTFPKPKGKYPVIVLSHGLGGSKDGLLPLSEYWASYGYVVIQPTHSDSMKYATPEQRRAFLQKKFRNVTDWKSRPADDSFILDSLASIESKVPSLKGKIDPKHIGIGGHSFGAHTTMLMSGATTRGLGGRQSFVEPRASAFLMISPQGKGGILDEQSWKTCSKPMMTISGSEDRDPFANQDPEWRKDPFKYSPSGDKFLIWITGAHHGFGGINGKMPFPGSGGLDEAQVTTVQDASLAFWDAFLREDLVATAWLKSGALTRATKGSTTVQRK